MKKIVLIILTVIFIIGDKTSVFASTEFTDLKQSNWAYEPVNAMCEKGAIQGYNDGSFKASNTVTFGEFIKMIVITETGEDVGNSKIGNWAKNFYEKAVELGYFTKNDISEAKLDEPITRSYMSYIVANAIDNGKIVDTNPVQYDFCDVLSNTPYCYYILKAHTYGVITGNMIGETMCFFYPEKTLTRAESAVVLYRLVDESKRIMPEENDNSGLERPKVTVTYANSSNRTRQYVQYKASIGDEYGIEKFVINQHGYVGIYSKVRYESISLVIDGVVTSGFGNPRGGDYWVKDGYYLYWAEPKKDGINVKGKVPSLILYPNAYTEGTLIEVSGVTYYPIISVKE